MLSDTEKERISARVGALEARSGTQIVTAFTERCDHYPEIPWQAFALGAALTAAILALGGGLLGKGQGGPLTFALVLSLCGGLGTLLLTVVLQPVARLFLERARAEAEVRQYAEGLFLQHELFATPARRAVLLLVTRFERRVVVLPDRGLQAALTPPVLDGIVAVMTARLTRGEVAAAIEAGLEALEPYLGVPGAGETGVGKLLPDEPIVTSGP
jgi:putative membrane protein